MEMSEVPGRSCIRELVESAGSCVYIELYALEMTNLGDESEKLLSC